MVSTKDALRRQRKEMPKSVSVEKTLRGDEAEGKKYWRTNINFPHYYQKELKKLAAEEYTTVTSLVVRAVAEKYGLNEQE